MRKFRAPSLIEGYQGLAPPKKIGRLVFQLIALALVVAGIYHSLRKSAQQLETQQQELQYKAGELRAQAEDASNENQNDLLEQAQKLENEARNFWKPEPGALLASGFFYFGGMLPACLFWRRCLLALDQPGHNLLAVAWAYFYGNLGKYFPGKAMVLVLRIASLEKFGAKKAATSITIFMETLTMMSVGGAVAAICLIALGSQWWLTVLAIGMVMTTFLPASPPVLRFLLPKLQRGVDPERIREWTSRINWTLFIRGWLMLAVTWLAFGVSLLFVLRSLPSANFGEAESYVIFLSATGACALAVVLGFVSLIPGGAGVREVVLSTVLAPVVGPTAALCAALWLRIVMLATELLVVGFLALVRMVKGE